MLESNVLIIRTLKHQYSKQHINKIVPKPKELFSIFSDDQSLISGAPFSVRSTIFFCKLKVSLYRGTLRYMDQSEKTP